MWLRLASAAWASLMHRRSASLVEPRPASISVNMALCASSRLTMARRIVRLDGRPDPGRLPPRVIPEPAFHGACLVTQISQTCAGLARTHTREQALKRPRAQSREHKKSRWRFAQAHQLSSAASRGSRTLERRQAMGAFGLPNVGFLACHLDRAKPARQARDLLLSYSFHATLQSLASTRTRSSPVKNEDASKASLSFPAASISGPSCWPSGARHRHAS